MIHVFFLGGGDLMAQYMDFKHNKYHMYIDTPDKEPVHGLKNKKNKNQNIKTCSIQNPNISMNFYEFLIRRKNKNKNSAVIPHKLCESLNSM